MSDSTRRFFPSKYDFLFRPDRALFWFAIRVTVAALLAFAVSLALKLQHPYWAALTSSIVAQRSRGMTLSKGFYRFLGTCLGTAVAFFMIKSLADLPWVFVTVLVLWISLCAGLAYIFRRFKSYGIMLAGFTTAIVALSVYSHPDNFSAIAYDRVIAIFVGSLAVVLVFAFLSRSQARHELLERIQNFVSEAVAWSSLILGRAARAEIDSYERKLIANTSELEDMTSYASAESLDIRSKAHRIRSLLASMISMMTSARALETHLARREEDKERLRDKLLKIAGVLERISEDIKSNGAIQTESVDRYRAEVRALSDEASAEWPSRAVSLQFLSDHLEDLFDSLQGAMAVLGSLNRRSTMEVSSRLSFHRDWRGAKIAFAQTALAVAIPGIAWLVSGWEVGPLVLLITAVHTVIFATIVNPVVGIHIKMKSAVLSFLAAVLCHWVLLPNGSGLVQIFVVLALILIPGSLAAGNRATALAGTFFTADFLLLLAPSYPMAFDIKVFTGISQAFVFGVLIPYLIFGYVLPADPSRKAKGLAAELAHDIELMAREPLESRAAKWESRMYNKVGKLLALVADGVTNDKQIIDNALAALDVGRETMRLKRLLHALQQPDSNDDEHSPHLTETIEEVLEALGEVSRNPRRAEVLLTSLAERLSLFAKGGSEQARLSRKAIASLEEIAATVSSHRPFFTRG